MFYSLSKGRMKTPTFLFFLPERDHLIQLPLNQPISLILIQPHPTRKCLLNPRERTVYNHLDEKWLMDV